MRSDTGLKNNASDRTGAALARKSRNAPTREQLIAQLITERAERIAATRLCRANHLPILPTERDVSQARREIETYLRNKP